MVIVFVRAVCCEPTYKINVLMRISATPVLGVGRLKLSVCFVCFYLV